MPRPSSTEDSTIDAHSATALTTAKHNLRYLYNPSTSPSAPQRRRTRAALRVLRSTLIFVFWRLVRYAKYVAIGSLVATVGAGALGTVFSGAAFVLAPTGIAGTIVAGTVWGVGRVVIRRLHKKWEKGHGEVREKRAVERRMGEGPEVVVPW